MLVIDHGLDNHNLNTQSGCYTLYRTLCQKKLVTIYLGEHVRLGREVVVKILNSRGATDTSIKAFCAHAHLHASLRHPNIVRVLDLGMWRDLPFVVMEYARRGTLQEHLLRNIPYPIKMLEPVIGQIAAAIQYLHSRCVIHRDIKPQNILLASQQEIWLSDFDIALTLSEAGQPLSQEAIGTPLYAAPEQIAGRPLLASDQYALAVLIYTWLCGQPPFVGNASQLCRQHLYAEPPALRLYVPTLSRHVEHAVLRALAKDPCQRFASIQDFIYALKA